MSALLHFEVKQPAHWRFLPWNQRRPQEQWVSSDPAWRAKHGAEAESKAAHEARQKAMADWIAGR